MRALIPTLYQVLFMSQGYGKLGQSSIIASPDFTLALEQYPGERTSAR